MLDGDYLARGLLDALVDDSKTAPCTIESVSRHGQRSRGGGGVCVRPSSSRTWYWPARASSVMLKNQGRSYPLSHEQYEQAQSAGGGEDRTGNKQRVGADARAQGPRQPRGSQQEPSPLTHGQGDSRGVRSSSARVEAVA